MRIYESKGSGENGKRDVKMKNLILLDFFKTNKSKHRVLVSKMIIFSRTEALVSI